MLFRSASARRINWSVRSIDAPSGRVKDGEEIALVFVRNETGRQLHEKAARSKPETSEAGEPDRYAPQEEAHATEISRS